MCLQVCFLHTDWPDNFYQYVSVSRVWGSSDSLNFSDGLVQGQPLEVPVASVRDSKENTFSIGCMEVNRTLLFLSLTAYVSVAGT